MTDDKTITCRDCAQAFIFSIREQEFFAERGFGDPVRCLVCRRAHKAKRQDGGAAPTGGPDHAPVRDIERRFSGPSGPRSPMSDDPGAERRYQPRRPVDVAPPMPVLPMEDAPARRGPREIVDDGGYEGDGSTPRGRRDEKKRRERRGYYGDDDD